MMSLIIKDLFICVIAYLISPRLMFSVFVQDMGYQSWCWLSKAWQSRIYVRQEDMRQAAGKRGERKLNNYLPEVYESVWRLFNAWRETSDAGQEHGNAVSVVGLSWFDEIYVYRLGACRALCIVTCPERSRIMCRSGEIAWWIRSWQVMQEDTGPWVVSRTVCSFMNQVSWVSRMFGNCFFLDWEKKADDRHCICQESVCHFCRFAVFRTVTRPCKFYAVIVRMLIKKGIFSILISCT